MTQIYDLQQRAEVLRKKTATDSISPEDVGGLHADTLAYIANMERYASSLGIKKVYTSVSEMNGDESPVSSTGMPLKAGQLVTIFNAEAPDAENSGEIYAFQNPGWVLVGRLDAGTADALKKLIEGDKATVTNNNRNAFVWLGNFETWAEAQAEIDKLHATGEDNTKVGEFRLLLNGRNLIVRNFVQNWATGVFTQMVEGPIRWNAETQTMDQSLNIKTYERRYNEGTGWTTWEEGTAKIELAQELSTEEGSEKKAISQKAVSEAINNLKSISSFSDISSSSFFDNIDINSDTIREWENKSYRASDGLFMSNNNAQTSDYIAVTPGNYVQYEVKTSLGTQWFSIVFFDNNKNILLESSIVSSDAIYRKYDVDDFSFKSLIKVPDGVSYMRISLISSVYNDNLYICRVISLSNLLNANLISKIDGIKSYKITGKETGWRIDRNEPYSWGSGLIEVKENDIVIFKTAVVASLTSITPLVVGLNEDRSECTDLTDSIFKNIRVSNGVYDTAYTYRITIPPTIKYIVVNGTFSMSYKDFVQKHNIPYVLVISSSYEENDNLSSFLNSQVNKEAFGIFDRTNTFKIFNYQNPENVTTNEEEEFTSSSQFICISSPEHLKKCYDANGYVLSVCKATFIPEGDVTSAKISKYSVNQSIIGGVFPQAQTNVVLMIYKNTATEVAGLVYNCTVGAKFKFADRMSFRITDNLFRRLSENITMFKRLQQYVETHYSELQYAQQYSQSVITLDLGSYAMTEIAGHTIAFFDDSIGLAKDPDDKVTEYLEPYPTWVANKLGCVCLNLARSGHNPYEEFTQEQMEKVTDDTRLIILGGTTNGDYGTQDEIDSTDKTKPHGLLNWVVEWFRENRPNAQLLFVNTGCLNANETGEATSDNYKWRVAYKEVAKHKCIPYMSVLEECQFEDNIYRDYYTYDGTHLNDKGAKRVASAIVQFILKNVY